MKRKKTVARLAAVCMACMLTGCTPTDDARTADDTSIADDTSTSDGTSDTSTSDGTPTTEDVPAGATLRDYCTEKQQEFLEQTREELPVELVFHDWVESAEDYRTTDEEIISGILRELRNVTVASKSLIVSTENRGLEFVTAKGETCSFWFDGRSFKGTDEACYILSGDKEFWRLVWEIREEDPEYQDLTE